LFLLDSVLEVADTKNLKSVLIVLLNAQLLTDSILPFFRMFVISYFFLSEA